MTGQTYLKHIVGIIICSIICFFTLILLIPFYFVHLEIFIPLTIGGGTIIYGLIGFLVQLSTETQKTNESIPQGQTSSTVVNKDQVLHSVSAYLSTSLLFPNSYLPLEWSHLMDMGANTPTAHRYTIRHKFAYNEVDGKKESEWLFYIDHDFKITSVVKL